jgi:hypothetical protein
MWYSRGVALDPASLARDGMLGIELGAALSLQAGSMLLLL